MTSHRSGEDGSLRPQNGGFTLLEMVISLGIGVIIPLVIFAASSIPQAGAKANRMINEMNHNGRIALDVMAQNLMMSGSGSIFTYCTTSMQTGKNCSRAAGLLFVDRDNPNSTGDGGANRPDQITLLGAPHGSVAFIPPGGDDGGGSVKLTFEPLSGGGERTWPGGLDAEGNPWIVDHRSVHTPAISTSDIELGYHILLRASNQLSYKLVSTDRGWTGIKYADSDKLTADVSYTNKSDDIFNGLNLSPLGGAPYN